MKPTIYFDYNATTPVDPRVIDKMRPYWTEKFGNSMATTSPYGWEADDAVENSRTQISKMIKCSPNEITFTSGASEANNWALFGLIGNMLESELGEIHILSSLLEHSSVLKCLEELSKNPRLKIEYVHPTSTGMVDLQDLSQKIRPNTKLMIAVWVNNEIGTINPIKEICEICHARDVLVHSDATQALGKVPVDLHSAPVDLMAFSAHKLYGPKGIGFLYHRAYHGNLGRVVRLKPLIYGGGHEKGLRSGTLNVPGIVGMAEALALAEESYHIDNPRIAALRSQFWLGLAQLGEMQLNGAPFSERAPGNLNFTISKCRVPIRLSGLAVSQGSACQSGQISASAILKGLGLSDAQAERTLRISLGRWTTSEEVERGLEIFNQFLN